MSPLSKKVRHDKVIKKRSFSTSRYSMPIGSVAAITVPVRKVKSDSVEYIVPGRFIYMEDMVGWIPDPFCFIH